MTTRPAPSYAQGDLTTPLLRETIGRNLESTVERFPGRDALVSVHQGIRQNYRAFNESVDRLAMGLLRAGLEVGDRVGIWSPNRAEWVWLQYATAKAGIILVNINPAYRTHELSYALGQSGCRMLVSAQTHLSSDYREIVAEVVDDLPDLEQVVFFDTPEWETLIEPVDDGMGEVLAERGASLHYDDPINIQYTSGTTGFPKGATLSHSNILNNAFFVGEACAYTEQDRVCLPVPLYHCFGMVLGTLACTTHGSAIVLPGAGFDPDEVLRAVEQERCTSLYGVPTMFIAELSHPGLEGFDLSSLRTGIMAGSPCPVEVMKQVIAEMNMTDVTIAYGMTETSPVSTQTMTTDSVERRVSTVGRVHPHVEIKIINPENGQTVGRGQEGELCTRGYSVMIGYWNDAEKTEESIDEEGWMHSGDLAVMDAEGYVNIVGRIKDMIIRGGENIYPREIEEFLYRHPAVEDVQVIGVPDERYGEQVMAWIKLRPGSDCTADDLRDFCRGRIAHFKVPHYVKFVEGFPMTVTGKIRKVEMREVSIAELGLGQAADTKSA
ncbi:MAG: AMP-binding protein [bacterium]|nr:AMP-binding protein [bacterium]MDE0642885.1 AMP-binding protein [bacterium]